MYNHIPALYTAKPTLADLYSADSTLFNTISLPQNMVDAGANLILPGVLLQKFGTLETIFTTSTEAKAGFQLWSLSNVPNWGKLWAALTADYNPIENYSMMEQMTNDTTVHQYGKTSTRTDNLSHTRTGTDTRTDNLSHTRTGTDTRTDNLTETETPNETNVTDSGVFGFNSATAVDDTTETATRTGTNTTANTGTQATQYNTTDADTGTQATQYNTTDADTGTQATADTGSDTDTRNYRLTRSGNIGVTTSQQMIESEIKLRGPEGNVFEIIALQFQTAFCVSVW